MASRNTRMPAACAPPTAVLAWLNTLQARDGLTQSLLLTMRWLVLEEIERTSPASHAASDFTTDEPNPFTLSNP